MQSSARETVQLLQFGVFLLPARPLGARVFWEVWQQRLIKSCARKYSSFLQHLRLMTCLSLCVAMIHFKVSRFALGNTEKRFKEQSGSSCFCKDCNEFSRPNALPPNVAFRGTVWWAKGLARSRWAFEHAGLTERPKASLNSLVHSF